MLDHEALQKIPRVLGCHHFALRKLLPSMMDREVSQVLDFLICIHKNFDGATLAGTVGAVLNLNACFQPQGQPHTQNSSCFNEKLGFDLPDGLRHYHLLILRMLVDEQ